MEGVWAEEYRPKSVSEIIGQPAVVGVLSRYVKSGNMPHLMFSGAAGIGKTTSAIALAKDLFGKNWRTNYLELNASDERGIETVRVKVKEFASTMPLGADFKIIFLDECDNMTKDAQSALRRIMEMYSSNTRFILSCNYPNKIIAPIQDRCQHYRLKLVPEEDIRDLIVRVAADNNLKFSDEALDLIATHANGSVRSALNLAQLFDMETDEISVDMVTPLMGSVLDKDHLKPLLKYIREGNFTEWERQLYKLFYEKSFSSVEIIDFLYYAVIKGELGIENKKHVLKAVEYLGVCDFNITDGGTEMIQIRCLMARLSLLYAKEQES